MKRIILLITISLCLLGISHLAAQHDVYSKLSPLTRVLVSQYVSDSTLKSKSLDAGSYRLPTFIKVNDTIVYQKLRDMDCDVMVIADSLATVQIPYIFVDSISRLAEVDYIEASETLSTKLDSARSVIKAQAAYDGLKLSQPYTGKGVLVGIVDIGFDFTHPTFYNPNGTAYRVKRAVNQGTNNTVTTFTDSASILAQKYSTNGTSEYHGTHVAGIAAGGGYTTNYRGIAYESDLMLFASNLTTSGLLAGIKSVFNYAASKNMPAVVNLSLGNVTGPHDGTSIFEQSMTALTGQGKIIVASAGNDGSTGQHISLSVPNDTLFTFLKRTDTKTATIGADIWAGEAGGTFSVAVDMYDASTMTYLQTTEFLSASSSSGAKTFNFQGGTAIYNVTLTPQLYSGNKKRNVLMTVTYPSTDTNNRYIFLIKVTSGESITHLWSTESASFASYSKKGCSNGDNAYTVSPPATAKSIIAVGASNDRNVLYNVNNINIYQAFGAYGGVSLFSSRGPTPDGRQKPDVSAPGSFVVSAFNSYYLATTTGTTSLGNFVVKRVNFNGTSYAWGAASGTSMACPVVSGTIALWLQANPTLTPSDILGIISRTSTQQASLTYPNADYGYGVINAYRGLADILGVDAIDDAFAVSPQEAVSVYRGNSTNSFHVRWVNVPTFYKVQVFDFLGRSLGTFQATNPAGNDQTFSISVPTKGAYLIHITTEKGKVVRKLTF